MMTLRLITNAATYHSFRCVLVALETNCQLSVSVLSHEQSFHYLLRLNLPTSFPLEEVWPVLEEGEEDVRTIGSKNVYHRLAELNRYSGNENLRRFLEWDSETFRNTTDEESQYGKLDSNNAATIIKDLAVKFPSVLQDDTTVMKCLLFASVIPLVPTLEHTNALQNEEGHFGGNLHSWFEAFFKTNQASIRSGLSLLGVPELSKLEFSQKVPRSLSVANYPFYVTTPIYYVNAAPHIGHIYSTLVADCLARYHSLIGEESFLSTGTDEHGQKIAKAAADKNQTPQTFTDDVARSFRDCFDEWDFKYNHFVRTTDPEHVSLVEKLWERLVDQDDIYLGTYEGWYCVSDESFLTATQVREEALPEGTGTRYLSVESGHPVHRVSEQNYLFRLSKYEKQLLEWLRSGPVIYPEFRRQEVIQLVQNGLSDLSVSRKKSVCDWAIPCPGDPDHVIYVWLDALTNYLTSAMLTDSETLHRELCAHPNGFDRWPGTHVLGKDILKFHAVYWPAFLFALGYAPPRKLIVHGWWTHEGRKISKSLGNAFDPREKVKRYGLDPIKYFLLRECSFKDDGDYSDGAMVSRLNGELADTLGNLVLRCVSVKLVPQRVVPTPGSYTPHDVLMRDETERLVGRFDGAFRMGDLQTGVKVVFEVLRCVNAYTTHMEPWKVIRKDTARAGTILYVMQDCLRICALLLGCVMPDVCDRVMQQLGVSEKPELIRGRDALRFGKLPPGTPLGETQPPLFQKIVEGKVPK